MSDSSVTSEPKAPSRSPSSNELSSSVTVDSMFKPSDLLSSPKSLSSSPSRVVTSSPDSLLRLMSTGSGMKSTRSPFSIDFDRLKKRVESNTKINDATDFDLYGYGYGYGADDEDKTRPSQPLEDAGMKRRRFQRRNSKTPAMLMAMNSPLLLHLDFLEDKKDHEKSRSQNGLSSHVKLNKMDIPLATGPKAFDSWEGGLEIAEDLVMHLQKRKRSSQP